MKANFDYENLKSIKFPKNYENKDASYKTKDFINSEGLKEKLSILENNIKYSNPNKNLQQFNIKLENKDYNFSNILSKNNNERINENEGLNHSIKLMDIKLNHQLLQNKIENMRKTLIKETNDSNYNTISTSNFLDLNPIGSTNNFQSNYVTPKSYNNRIEFDNTIKSKDKENNINFNNLSKEDKEFSIKNNYMTSNNFYNSKDQFNTFDNQSSERFRNTYFSKNIETNILQNKRDENLFSKTIGNFDYERNSILPKYKINNNEIRLDYTKKDLADLEGKIQNTKKKLNDCIHRAETLVIDKRINKNIIDKDILNDNHKQYDTYKTIDSKSLRNNIGLSNDDELYLNGINSNRMRDANLNNKNTYKKDKIKNPYSYEDTSSENSIQNSSDEKIHRGFNREQESYSTFNPRSTLNQNIHKNYPDDAKLKFNLINNKPGSKSDRTTKIQSNEYHSNLSSSRTGKRLQQNNQDENLFTIQTISNTNNNNTINIMDSLRISENSEEDLEDNNPFLTHDQDQSSNVHLNISGIAADLISIKNENVKKQPRAAERIRENNKISNLGVEEKNKKSYKEKGKNNYQQNIDDNIDSNLFYNKEFPKSTKNKNVNYLYKAEDQENIEEKKPLKSHLNLKYSKQLDNSSDNFTPRSKKNQNSLNNEKLKNIGNSISPIKNNEKIKFTEKEIEELISKYLEQNTPKDNSNSINQLKNFAKNFSIKTAADKNKLKNLIINEMKHDKGLDVELDNQNDKYSHKANESENYSSKNDINFNAYGTINRQRAEWNPAKNNKDAQSEKDHKLKDIFDKIPEIISEFNNKKGKIIKDTSEMEKPNAQFFNLNNLSKWIDLSKTNLLKNVANNSSHNESNFTGKDILNEADNIINNHVLKMKKKENYKEVQNNLDLQVEKIMKNENEENKKLNNLEAETTRILSRIPSKDLNQESKETLDNKINYIYDLLKNFSHTKLKDLITTKISKQVSKEEISNNLNESTNVKENMQRLSNKEILVNKKVEKDIEYTIRKDEKDIIYSDNKKISFEMPKISMRLREDEESHLYHECKENYENDYSPNMLLSPKSKNFLDNNLINLESHLIHSGISENTKENVSKIKLYEKNNEDDPFEIIEKREEKLIEDNIVFDRPEITESPEKRDISPTKLKKKSNLNKNHQNNKNIILTAVDNGKKENSNEINNQSVDQDQEDIEENQMGLVSKKINFTQNENENESEESLDYELSKGNQDKEESEYEENNTVFEDDQNEGNLEEKFNEENENQENIYSEEEPRSLDNCINKLNSSSNFKQEDKPHVRFEKFLHSNSAKIITSRNFKTKNAENLRSDFENGIEENQRHNHSDLEIENEKIDEEIKAELNKNVISDTPYMINENKSKVKFSEKLVFIEYDDESVAENIKVYNQAGKPEKHNKFNLLKYLIRIKNNKYKSKKILRYYYNGIRDDRLPKKLLSNLKRANSFSEQDKELGLKKLNEFLSECNKENQLSDVKEQQKKRIVERNINTIHEIEEARKKGMKIKRVRSPTPKKIVHSHVCKKFKGDPNKFFSKNPPNSLLKVFNIPIDNSALKSVKSIGKFSERIFNKSNNDKRIGLTTTDQDKIDKRNHNKNKLHEFNLNSNPTQKNQKEKELKNIISNINLEESMNSLERESSIFKESELLNDLTSLNSYVQSPEKNNLH